MWLTVGAAIGSLVGSLVVTSMTWAIPDMKIATAYVCGKLDQIHAVNGLPPATGCAAERAIYERETRR
jgi:hypothetical protein